MKRLLILLAMTLPVIVLNSCLDDDDDKKDWSEKITIYVGSEIVDFYPFENNGVPSEGINIKEESSDHWTAHPLNAINGFVFEENFEYKLSVTKTHLAIYPADGMSFTYSLNKVITKNKKQD